MYIPFDQIATSARVWVYQANRKFSDEEVKMISANARNFCDSWAAHGAPLQSSFEVYHNQFVVIAVDEQLNMASGCSIDSSVSLMKQLESGLNVSFFDRTQIAFESENEVFTTSMNGIKEKISEGKISADTLTFNNLVKDVGELRTNWRIPAGKSWLNRYFV